jgi:hypothetical protein
MFLQIEQFVWLERCSYEDISDRSGAATVSPIVEISHTMKEKNRSLGLSGGRGGGCEPYREKLAFLVPLSIEHTLPTYTRYTPRLATE